MSTVLSAITAASNDARVRASMALGAALEGGNLADGPFPVGDGGTSVGPFQIHLPAHPDITAAQAADPVSATAYMLGEDTGAVARVPASLWKSDPQAAATRAAFLAERPAKPYATARGQATVDSAWKVSQTALSGGGVSAQNANFLTDTLSTAGTALGGLLLGGPIGGLIALGTTTGHDVTGGLMGGIFDGVGRYLLLGSAVLVGGALVVVGLSSAVKQTAPVQAAKSTAQSAGKLAATVAAPETALL